MNRNRDASALETTANALVHWFESGGIPYVIIGGIAASLLGRPRTTYDVDVLACIGERPWTEFIASGEQWGLVPRICDVFEFARESRVFLLRHEPTGTSADIVIAGLPYEEEIVAHGQIASLGNVSVRVACREDLIVMKGIARRPRDIADIESLLDVGADVDWEYVMPKLREFAQALDASDIVRGVEDLRKRFNSK